MKLRSAALMALSAAIFAAYFSQPPSTTSLPSPARPSGETGAAANSDEVVLTADTAAAGQRWELARAERTTTRGKNSKSDHENRSSDTSKIGTKTAAKAYDRPTRAEGRAQASDVAKGAPVVEPPPAWTDEEIAEAKAKCVAILQRISAVAVPQPPIREGSCGAPAPIQLVSIGKSPEVAISPPAVMTCELAEALDTWVRSDIQPLARKHLGSEVIRIESLSSYACRNAYGRVGNKLSEHGRANALDIRGFVTASAKTAIVLEDWGVTQREIEAEIAAAKAAAEQAELERRAAEKAAQETLKDKKGGPAAEPPAAASGSTAGAPARGTVVDGVPKVSVTMPGGKKKGGGDVVADAEPSHLGASKSNKGGVEEAPSKAAKGEMPASPTKSAKTETAKSLVTKTAQVKVTVGLPIKPPDPGVKGEFLRAVHAGACRIFGTTLGPEANADHRNHFHVDMAPRKHTKICD